MRQKRTRLVLVSPAEVGEMRSPWNGNLHLIIFANFLMAEILQEVHHKSRCIFFFFFEGLFIFHVFTVLCLFFLIAEQVNHKKTVVWNWIWNKFHFQYVWIHKHRFLHVKYLAIFFFIYKLSCMQSFHCLFRIYFCVSILRDFERSNLRLESQNIFQNSRKLRYDVCESKAYQSLLVTLVFTNDLFLL